MAQTENRKLPVRKGDTVVVLVGKKESEGGDKGKKGKIIATSPKANAVIVENVNLQKKHRKARSAQDTGGIIEKAGPVNVSNVQIMCPSCKKPTRIGKTTEKKGDKEIRVRVCKKCGESLDKAASVKTEKKAKEPKAKEAPQAEKPKKEKSKKEDK